jgi:hypothetical protein
MSHEQLVELTDYETAAAQIRWLRAHGWRFEVNAAGRPKVALAHFERKMGCHAVTPEPPPEAKHNFGALKLVKA